MERPIVIILRGHAAGGKTTLYDALKKPLTDFMFIDHGAIKHALASLGDEKKRSLAKEVLVFYMKQVMEQKFNVAIEEMSGDYIKKQLGTLINENHYQVFQFRPMASLPTVLARAKAQKRTMTRDFLEKSWADWGPEGTRPEKTDIVIDTEKLSLDQCVKMVLKTIGR